MISLTPELKAQLAEQKKQCVFCKLISGEMQAKKVFEDSKTVALLDIYPALKGHTLFMTKEHYPIMPYIPADEFQHLFGILPALAHAVMKGVVATGVNVFIANGGVAGQQAPHFLIHLLPREKNDGFFNFFFNKKQERLAEEKRQLLHNSFSKALQQYFSQHSLPHQGSERPPSGDILYEDEKVLCLLPSTGIVAGEIQIVSKKNSFIELSPEEGAYLFTIASAAASLLFEMLQAQGTNIIVKSGRTDDNPDGTLRLHILPRKQGDHLTEMLWKPQQPSYDLEALAQKIKDHTWKISYQPKIYSSTAQILSSGDDEIRDAIRKFH